MGKLCLHYLKVLATAWHPHYHANYYAAFVIGPDGHNIEVVCHKPEAQHC